MTESVRRHYERYPYPRYPLLASVRACDTYALNLTALWSEFNGGLPPEDVRQILIAGCGSFSPYPFSVANPGVQITALDLSGRSLRRAHLHCLLHGRRNVCYHCGDLLDATVVPGRFGLIDAYGVLHHLNDPGAGLRSLEARLAPGGIMRVMLYSRYARREEESIRRAFRLLGICDASRARQIIRRSAHDSRLRKYIEASDEAGFKAGLADALLHPAVWTFRIEDVLELVQHSGLQILRFAHYGALENVADEVERIRNLESDRQSSGNFLFYLGHTAKKTDCSSNGGDAQLVLNPCLKNITGPLQFGTVRIPPRLGFENPPLGRCERKFLRSFRTPRALCSLDAESLAAVSGYKKALFLLQF